MSRARGFTLIEVMIALVIVSILAGLAVASYQSYVRESNRSVAWSMLLQIQGGEEKYFLQNSTYTGNLTAVPTAGGLGLNLNASGGNLLTPDGNYALTIATVACAGAGGGLCSYTATATAAGAQLKDTAACQVLTVNSLGQRTPADSTGCWR